MLCRGKRKMKRRMCILLTEHPASELSVRHSYPGKVCSDHFLKILLSFVTFDTVFISCVCDILLLSSSRGRKLQQCSRPQAYIHLSIFHLSLLICPIWFHPTFPVFTSLLLPKIINLIIASFSSCISPSYFPNCCLNTTSSASLWKKKEQWCLWQNVSWHPNCPTVEGDVGGHKQDTECVLGVSGQQQELRCTGWMCTFKSGQWEKAAQSCRLWLWNLWL